MKDLKLVVGLSSPILLKSGDNSLRVNQKAKDSLVNARLNLIWKHTWWGYLSLKLSFHENPGQTRTTAVNAKGEFYYDPEWINNMSMSDCSFEIAHELMHIIQKCMSRAPVGCNKEAWNLAADYKADEMLVGKNEGDGLMPSAISRKMVPEEIRKHVRPMVIEQVYRDLLKNNPDQCKDKNIRGCDRGTSGNPDGIPDPDSSDTQFKKAGEQFGETEILKWQMTMLQAEQYCKESNQEGSIPGNIKDFLVKLKAPTISWKDKLRYTATSVFKSKYTFKRPSRRAQHLNVRLQRRKRTPEGVVLFFDTSGSMSDKELIQSASEAVTIINSCGAAFAHVFFHDVNCYYHAKYTAAGMTNLKVTRGGTSHIDVFKVAQEEIKNIGMIVAFTDLETSYPKEDPKVPVLWCHAGNRDKYNPPFGQKVEMKLE